MLMISRKSRRSNNNKKIFVRTFERKMISRVIAAFVFTASCQQVTVGRRNLSGPGAGVGEVEVELGEARRYSHVEQTYGVSGSVYEVLGGHRRQRDKCRYCGIKPDECLIASQCVIWKL